MLSCHELIGFMSPALSQEILEFAFSSDKQLYRATLAAVAEVLRVRPAYLEKKPRKDRHIEMIATLGRPRLEEAAANLLRAWLLKKEIEMVTDFLNSLGIAHEQGVVNEFPETVEDEKLQAAVDALLSKYPVERVAVYLNSLIATSVPNWKSLSAILEKEQRLQF